jgi:hypothetical protein
MPTFMLVGDTTHNKTVVDNRLAAATPRHKRESKLHGICIADLDCNIAERSDGGAV